MSHYVLAFRARPDREHAATEEADWGAWFGALGEAVVDRGNRVDPRQTVAAHGARLDGAAVTGYIVVDAADDNAAVDLARGCPGLRHGVSVEVGQSV
jgi:hypothetical protein